MSVGPDSVSVQSNLMQLDTQDLPGWKRTTNTTRHRSYGSACTCSRVEIVKLEQSYLIENGGAVLVLVEAGNVLANAAAR